MSGERIVGRDNYVRINAEYPQGWSIRVLRIVADGPEVVSEVEVPHTTMGVHRVASDQGTDHLLSSLHATSGLVRPLLEGCAAVVPTAC